MNHIIAVRQRIHIVGIPLEHLPASVQILCVVIGATNTVLIDVCQLRFNPGGIIALFVKDGAHGVPETVPGSFTVIADTFDDLVDAGFAHWLTSIMATGAYELTTPGELVDFFQQRFNLAG